MNLIKKILHVFGLAKHPTTCYTRLVEANITIGELQAELNSLKAPKKGKTKKSKAKTK